MSTQNPEYRILDLFCGAGDIMTLRALHRRWWDFRCLRLGWHKAAPIREDAYGVHGGDCWWCGAGPL